MYTKRILFQAILTIESQTRSKMLMECMKSQPDASKVKLCQEWSKTNRNKPILLIGVDEANPYQIMFWNSQLMLKSQSCLNCQKLGFFYVFWMLMHCDLNDLVVMNVMDHAMEWMIRHVFCGKKLKCDTY